MIVIVTNFSTSFTLSPALKKDIFNIDGGLPYCPPEKCKGNEYKKLTQFSYVQILSAVREGYSIILLNYTPIVGQLLDEMRNGTRRPDASGWLILSFFHSDKTLHNTGVLVAPDMPIDPLLLMREKYKDLERMSAYPFIKKYEIPNNYVITIDLLKSISVENSIKWNDRDSD